MTLKRVGPYEVLRELGKGGFGLVLLGKDTRPGKPAEVAVKLLREPLDLEARHRFDREARLLASLDHPGIVRLLDHGLTERSQPWLSLEYLPGGSLLEKVEREGPLSPALVAKMGSALAAALDHAHARQFVHRDLKPANILFDAAGEPRLADFGLGRCIRPDASRITETGVILGTPAFMAPEQAQDALVPTEADVYALGATLYYALIGRPPFVGESAMETLDLVMAGDLMKPSELREGIDPALDRLIVRCLDKDPGRRPSAKGLSEALSTLGQDLAPKLGKGAPLLTIAGVTVLLVGAAVWMFARSGPTPLPDPASPITTSAPPTPRALPATWAAVARDPEAASNALEALGAGAPMPQVALRARLRLLRGDLEGAQRDATRAIELAPADAQALFARGEVRARLGELEDAAEDLRRGLESSSESDARLVLAQVLFRLGRYREALDQADALLASDPGLAAARLIRAQVRLEGGDLPGAKEELDLLLSRAPDSAEGLGWRAEVALRMGDHEAAERDAERALALDPEERMGLWARIRLRRDRGDHAAAREDVRRFLELWPGDLEAEELERSLPR